jgi:hypothetical protein
LSRIRHCVPNCLMCGPFPGAAEHGSDEVIRARRLSDQRAGDIPASGTKDPSHGRGTDRRTARCCRTQEPKVTVVAIRTQVRGACPMPVRTFGVEASTDGIASQLHELVGLVRLAGRLNLAKPARKRRPSMMHNPSHIEARPLSEDQDFALFYPYCRPTRPLSARRTKSLGDIPHARLAEPPPGIRRWQCGLRSTT